jgi:hypothetical protein
MIMKQRCHGQMAEQTLVTYLVHGLLCFDPSDWQSVL